MEGVEKRRDGRYRVRAEYRDPKTGRRREIDRLVIASSAAEAASLRASLLAARLAERGEKKADRVRLGDALAAWRRGKALTLRPSSAERYDTAIERWAATVLGDYYLDAVRPDDVREVLAGWSEAELAAETVNGRLRVLRTFAAEYGCRAIVDGVHALPAAYNDDDEGRGLTLEELRALLLAGPTAAKPTKQGDVPVYWPRAWALIATLALTGLRFGEASALAWSDVDLDGALVRVRRAQWRGIIGHPKARASARTVPIDPELVATLRTHRETMLARQLPGVDSALVFPARRKSVGGLVTNGHARGAMLAASAAAEVKLGDRPALHCLRHTLSNLIRQHASEEVRRAIIGHTAEVRTYTRVEVEEQRAAMGRVLGLVRKG